MGPMDAWSIISKNLSKLRAILIAVNGAESYTEADIEAEVIAFRALKDMEERQTNKPLTLKELRQMEGDPVWVKIFDKSGFADPQDAIEGWYFVRKSWVRTWDKDRADVVTVSLDFADYKKTWIAYRYKLEGDS